MRKRFLSLLCIFALLMGLMPTMAFAADADSSTYGNGLCEHHTQHTADCGYTEGTAEIPCSHEHTEDCYTLVTECVHAHTAECYPAESVSENTATPSEPEEAEPTECTHECSEESGCVIKTLDCKHTHDEACGYVPATAGTPCTFVCEVCNAQDSGNPATPSDVQPEECTCEILCTDEEINADCPVCSAEGAELDKVCAGIAPMLPATALAAAPNGMMIYVGDENVTSSGYWTTDSSGNVTAYTGGGTPTDNYIHYAEDTNTLILHNAIIKESVSSDTNALLDGAAIGVLNQSGDTELIIQLEGNNTIENVNWGLYVLADSTSASNAGLTITGSGSLDTSTRSCGIYVQSNSGDTALNITDAEVTATASGIGEAVWVRAGDDSNISLTVDGGSLTGTGIGTYGGGIGLQFGDAASSSGTPTVTVSNNATVWANGNAGRIENNSSTDIQFETGSDGTGGIVWNGKDGTVYGNVTLQEDLTIREGESLTVGDGAKLTVPEGKTITVEIGGKLNGDVDGKVEYPTTAEYVAPNELWVGGTNVVTGGYWTTNEDGSLTVSDSNNYNVWYDGNGNLWLNNADIIGQGSSGHAATGIYAYYDKWVDTDIALTIHLVGKNSVSRGYPIYVGPWGGNASLTITGQGSLNATSTVGGNGGIFVQGDTSSLTIEDGADVTVNSARSSAVTIVADAQGTGTLTIDNATLRAYGHVIDEPDESYSICFSYSGNSGNIVDGSRVLRLSGNSVVHTDYMQATYTRLVIEASEDDGGIIIDGKDGTVYGDVTLQEDLEIQIGETLTIGKDTSLTVPDDVTLTNNGTIIVERGGKLIGEVEGNGTVIDRSSPVSYLDENGTAQICDDYNVVTVNDTEWTDGWYVVNSDVTINQRISVSDNVKLILTDGHALTVNGGIHVTGDNHFTVYGQKNGTGKLTATATNDVGAGIGGNGSTTTSAQNGENGGTIVIAGGTIEAIGGDVANDTESPSGGAGIGNGGGVPSNGGSVTIYGGKVNATGGAGNVGIGGNGSTIQILGGTVDATSEIFAAAIGAAVGDAGTITITNSTVTANGDLGTGIGSGWKGDGGTITITNSTVTAIGGYGAGIGGGSGDSSSAGGNGGNVTIVNSTVTASSTEGDSIGAGKDGADPGTLTLSPADGKAIAAKAGADEASALALNGSPFTAETAVTDLVRGTRYFHSEPCGIYPVTVTGSCAQTTGAGSYAEGATVTIDAGTRSGYTFDGWTSADGVKFANADSEKTTFTMPNKAVTVTANWTENSSGGSSDPTYSVTLPGRVEGGTVTANKRYAEAGETFRFKAIPDEGWVLDTLTATDSKGNELDLTPKGGNEYTFKMPARSVTVAAVFIREGIQKLPFMDVAENAWFADAAAYVYEHGLMAGTSATTFAPNATTSRSMIATILWRMAGSPVVDYAMNYTDVAQGQWYSEAVRWATSEGIVGGYGNGLFGTNDPITREQFAAMLYRFAQEQGYDVSIGENTNILSYTDVADLSEYAISAMQWAVGAGIINGTGDGSTLSPQGQATRAQAAVMLMRFCEEYVTW